MFQSLELSTLVIIFVVLVISITIHEALHAFTGSWLGDDTAEREGRITLNPLKHIDPVMTIALPMITVFLFQTPILAAKPVPFNPARVKWDEFGAALIALAGPLTNLGLAVVAAGFIRVFQGGLGPDLLQIFSIFMIINVMLFVFNMIPIPPLDGSRVLYAFSPEPIQRVLATLEQFGFVIIFGLVLLVPPFMDFIRQLNSDIVQILIGTPYF